MNSSTQSIRRLDDDVWGELIHMHVRTGAGKWESMAIVAMETAAAINAV